MYNIKKHDIFGYTYRGKYVVVDIYLQLPSHVRKIFSHALQILYFQWKYRFQPRKHTYIACHASTENTGHMTRANVPGLHNYTTIAGFLSAPLTQSFYGCHTYKCTPFISQWYLQVHQTMPWHQTLAGSHHLGRFNTQTHAIYTPTRQDYGCNLVHIKTGLLANL